MTEFEDPFQMDEELDERDLNITPQYPPINNFIEDQINIRSRIDELDLTNAFPDKNGHLKENLKIQGEQEEYEEDLDDKFDAKVHEVMNNEYTKFKKNNEPLTPPENFAPVVNKIYRSSFPQANNFDFLKRLKLKSILCLIPDEYPDLHKEFLEKENIKLFQMGMSGNKEPFVVISHELITEALKVVLNPENHPILIHCNRGKHRTGCLIGILRRLQNWSLTIIFDEYRKFAAPKERPMDQQFIELYNEDSILKFANDNKLLPLSWD
ncbi:inositol phosphatase Siw14p [[Candida] jaroonii]|uniref:Inositol phosphatase Siw14p n=1 Tax=[Candida] jaroonii TaxID=467808 RepID=A0ACA9YAP8_9ASCO|nr:inositol phosphatase Siw14p [[Candida] jaroonii]